MRLLVLGGSGQVGHHLLMQGARRGHSVVGTSFTQESGRLRHLDLADESSLRELLESVRPDVVFCTAAWTFVDGCEREPEAAHRQNVEQPVRAAELAAQVAAKFVFFSTDYVFPGEGPIYDEECTPRPLNVYGRTKLEAERRLMALDGPTPLILRTAVVYGPERRRKNTIYQLLQAHIDGRSFRVATDQVCNPTYSPNLAAAAIELAEKGADGILHVAGADIVSRYDFARMACTILKLDEARLVPVTTEEFGSYTKRPLDNGLDISRAQSMLRLPLIGCAEGLSAFHFEAPLASMAV